MHATNGTTYRGYWLAVVLAVELLAGAVVRCRADQDVSWWARDPVWLIAGAVGCGVVALLAALRTGRPGWADLGPRAAWWLWALTQIGLGLTVAGWLGYAQGAALGGVLLLAAAVVAIIVVVEGLCRD